MITRREVLRRGIAGLGVLACGAPAPARSAERPVKPFGDAIVIAGGPRERGRRYGRRFRDEIGEFLDREIYRAFEGSLAAKEELLRYAAACSRVIRAECPVIADELEGMAEATGLRLEEHVLITLHEELYHRGVLPPVSHCTAVAVGPPEAPGRTFVGQTWDWMESVAGMSSALEWRRDDGPSLLAYAFPGLWVGAGLNSAGLALVLDQRRARQAEAGAARRAARVRAPGPPAVPADARRGDRGGEAGPPRRLVHVRDGRRLRPPAERRGLARGRRVRGGDRPPRAGRVRLAPDDGDDGRTGRAAPPALRHHGRPARPDAGSHRPGCHADELRRSVRGICVGKATIDMMVFDTTARTAHLSRGPEYGVAWRPYGFAGGAK